MRVLHTPSSSAITRVTRPIRTLPDTLRPIPYNIIEIQYAQLQHRARPRTRP